MGVFMLEKVDLSKKLSKHEYDAARCELEPKLGDLQRQAKRLNIPIVLVFEGWGAAGKGILLNELILGLDPRGYTVYSLGEPTDEEETRPHLRRYWIRTPEQGRIAIFDQSWYRRVLMGRVDTRVDQAEWARAYQEINSFEQQLADGGCVLVKFFLHISKKEQTKRLKAIEQDPAAAWRVTKSDWQENKHYKYYAQAVEEMIERTDTACAPWHLIEAHDKKFATIKIYSKVIEAVENRIKQQAAPVEPVEQTSVGFNMRFLEASILDKVDLSKTVAEGEYKAELERLQQKIHELSYVLYHRKIPMIILYEGMDAAGKGSNIRRLVQPLDPRGYEVVPVGAPNDIEKAHHYLWRFWKSIPAAGHIAIFDRTWYGRVLVERVEAFSTPEQWKRAYREINEMEQQFVSCGDILVKLWLHIDKDEQLRRFEQRMKNADKQWKITDDDWRNRAKWDQYIQAADEMLLRTSTTYAPWTIVEGNSKYYARVKALRTIVSAIEARL